MLNFVFRKVSQVASDLVIFAVSLFAAYFIRFEGAIPHNFLKQILILFPYIIIARFISFQLFSVYIIVWRYISIRDVLRILYGVLPVTILLALARYLMPASLPMLRMPISVIILDFLMVILGTSGIRMAHRVSLELKKREDLTRLRNGASRRVLLIGAGDAGNMVAKELNQRADLGMQVVGFVDDDPKKFNATIQGFRILGSTAQIPDFVSRLNVEGAIITIANASSKDIRRIIGTCEGAGLKVKIIPGLFELLDEHIKISKIREIKIDDLLGRNIIAFENHLPEVTRHYKDKRILVAGAGGSIGSELCRQLAPLWPKEVILLDKDENSIYEIDAELKSRFEGLPLRSIIANIKNKERLEHIFKQSRPEIIFHAAAHKHVPLMESNVSEAILNNVCGTENLARLASRYNVEKFVFISTDKAINPTSVMGATKKLGEIIIQGIAANSPTRSSCVRFGNVLGSRGSVVPMFQKQIANGGPVTVTHPDVKRYFMSISEAVQLIIQAGTIGDRGEIFVLDMGEQIKIVDLAKDLIKLSGYNEGDIELKYIGLRPGEKLFEEILVDEERAQATEFEKIFIAPPIENGREDFQEKMSEIVKAAEQGDEAEVLNGLKQIGIGYSGERKGR